MFRRFVVCFMIFLLPPDRCLAIMRPVTSTHVFSESFFTSQSAIQFLVA